MTNAENDILQSEHERELNQQLEFDEDWNENTWMSQRGMEDDSMCFDDDNNSLAGVSEISLEEILERDSTNIYSDPESEWNSTNKFDNLLTSTAIETPDNDDSNSSDLLRPECEQSPTPSPLTVRKSYSITSIAE